MGGKISCPKRNIPDNQQEPDNHPKPDKIEFRGGSTYEGGMILDYETGFWLQHGQGVYQFPVGGEVRDIIATFDKGEIDFAKRVIINYSNESSYFGMCSVVDNKIVHEGDGIYKYTDEEGNCEQQEGFFKKDKLRIGTSIKVLNGTTVTRYTGLFDEHSSLTTGCIFELYDGKNYQTEIKDGVIVETDERPQIKDDRSHKGSKKPVIHKLSQEELEEAEEKALNNARELLEQEDRKKLSDKDLADQKQAQIEEGRLNENGKKVRNTMLAAIKSLVEETKGFAESHDRLKFDAKGNAVDPSAAALLHTQAGPVLCSRDGHHEVS